MTSYKLENTFYPSPEITNKKSSPPQVEPTQVQDFLLDHEVLQPVVGFCQDNNNWSYVVSHLRQQLFNSTSVTFPAPETYFVQKAKNENQNQQTLDILSSMNSSQNQYNSDPFAVSDTLEYRRHRSENLLIRMIHCANLDVTQVSLMRLSKGVFVHQKWQSSSPQSSPTLSTIEASLSSSIMDNIDEAPIDTFHFNKMTMAGHLSSSCYDMFVPYSYTFGARYTNPYGAHDLVIRGKLPLWCQTLFLSVCIKQKVLQPNIPLIKLFPFAPQVPVTFRSLLDFDRHAITPELILLYERFTMEHTDPYAMPDEDNECQWSERKQEVLKNVLVCDINDDLAKVLTDMATVWAASRGLML